MLKQYIKLLTVLAAAAIFCQSYVFAAKNESLEKAREAASHEEWEQSADFAKQAVAADAEDEAGWSVLGDAQMALGDTASAVASYEKSVSFNPKFASSILPLTAYYVKQNHVDDAERIVSKAEEKDPKGKIDEIKVARGLIFAKQGNFAEATKILASASAKNPKNPLYPQILARLYKDAGVKEQAAVYYENAWKLAPGDPVLAYEYALVLQDLQKYNEALDLFKKVQEKDPKNKTVDYMIGRLYFASGRFLEAAKQFELAVDKRPDHFLSNFLLGKSYFEFSKAEKKNFYKQAEAALRTALKMKPDRTDVSALLGEAIFTQGKLYYQRAIADTTGKDVKALCDSSIAECHDALSFNSTLTGVNSQLARAWNKAGNLDSCIAYSKIQMSLTPDDQSEFARLVNAQQRKKDQAGLVETLKPAYEKLDWMKVKADGDTTVIPQDKFLDKFAGVYVNALIETNKSKDAREALKIMLTYKPTWCDGHGLNAYIDLKHENYAGAVPSLQAGLKSCPKDGDLWNSLGDAYYFSDPKNKENVKKAKEAYQRACNLGNRDACGKLEQLGK